jgi:acyl carrier protein
VILLGRIGLLASNAMASKMTSSAAELIVEKCDVAFREDLASLTADKSREIHGVFHAGGVVHDAAIHNQQVRNLFKVLAPKISGMESLTKGFVGSQPLHVFKVFSSIAAPMGSGGQANYAAANAALDMLSDRLCAGGMAAVSVNWGPWAGAGMAANVGLDKMQRLGYGAIKPEHGALAIAALCRFACNGPYNDHGGRILASVFYWDRLKAKGDAYMYLRSKQEEQRPEVPVVTKASRNKETPQVSRDAIYAQVHAAVVSVLGTSPGSEDPLVSSGLDSLGAVELRNEISRLTGMELPGTLVFDFPTMTAISGFLVESLMPPEATEILASNDATGFTILSGSLLHSITPQTILISSFSQRLPTASNCDDPLKVVPLDRWDADHGAKMASPVSKNLWAGRFGAFVNSWASFDPALFGVSLSGKLISICRSPAMQPMSSIIFLLMVNI